MATIGKTIVCTSDPVDLTKGIALYPGYSFNLAGSADATLWDVAPQILAWRIHSAARVVMTAGLGGPAYGVRMQVEGGTSGNSMALDVSYDEVEAGLLFGWQLTFNFLTDIDQWCVHWIWDGWQSHFSAQWENVFSGSVSVTLDVISLLARLIQKIVADQGLASPSDSRRFAQTTNLFPNLLRASYGLIHSRRGFTGNGGSLALTPTLHFDVNLVECLAQWADGAAPGIEAVAEFANRMRGLAGDFATGPSLGLSIPTTVTMSQLRADAADYSNLVFSEGKVSGTGPSAAATVSSVGVEFKQEPGFDFTIGWFVQVSVLKVFSWCAHWDKGVLDLLGVRPTAGPYYNLITNDVGSGSVMTNQDAGFVQVDFEPAEALA